MNNVISLFDPDRYCLTCKKVDCPDHCWGCGAPHAHDTDIAPYCTACVLEMETDNEPDLGGFWKPEGHEMPVRGGRKRVYVEDIDAYRAPEKADLIEDVVIDIISNLQVV